MPITALSRDMGRDPAIVRIVTTDSLATITTAGYITAQESVIAALNFGAFEWADTDAMLISYASGEGLFTRNASTEAFVAQPASPGTLSNTLPSGDIFVGSAGNVATGVAMSGDTTISNAGVVAIGANKVLSSMVSPLLLKYVAVPVTAAQFKAAYATPLSVLAAGGASTIIVVERAVLAMTYVSAQYTAGGATGLQYGATAHLAAPKATATIAAATINADAASAANMVSAAIADVAFTACVNTALYLSNDTAAFATGDSTFVLHLWYKVIPSV